MLDDWLADTFAAFRETIEEHAPRMAARETGTVTHVGEGIARVHGLRGVRSEEMLVFSGGGFGMAFNLDAEEIGVVLLDEAEAIEAGTEVRGTGRLVDVPVGEALLGRVVDGLGRPLDRRATPGTVERRPVEREAPAIMHRAPVEVPLQTGLKAVDTLVPVGRGQRELIVGDRQTGKTAVAVDAIINQRDTGVVCIYCAIGQRGTAVARVVDALREAGSLEHSVVMVGPGEATPGLQFVTPYAAMSVGEWFMEQGRDVLLVLDDLTRHARAYRQLSLLLRRPPGREAYPGDIFYVHSRLLERSTRLRPEHGGGSLTTLPVVETQAQNIAAYIPTNLISITDGQIYLSPELFRKAVLPAVDVGKSVSRVGGKTQLPALRAVAGDLRLAYSQFEELETFARFGTRLDEATREQIEHGRRVRELLKQPRGRPLRVCEQAAVMLAASHGLFDSVDLDAVADAERRLREAVVDSLAGICERIEAGEALADADRDALLEIASEAIGAGGRD